MIHYQTHGHADSQPVILLHSGGMAGEEWQPQIAPLAQRYRVLVPDLPGHGRGDDDKGVRPQPDGRSRTRHDGRRRH